jgi:uncharacterized protein DUF6644
MSAAIRQLADWISTTPLSHFLQDHLWIIPVSQSIHILSIAIVFTSASVISLRLLGVSASGRSISQLVGTLVPWMYRALGALLLTGSLQTIAEPVRQFVTPEFWLKMCMIVCVTLLTIGFARAVHHRSTAWDNPSTRPASAKVFAVVSLMLWLAIIVCGRLIGYVWLSYA